jgi:F0F1-type ATP synthase delta subunit
MKASAISTLKKELSTLPAVDVINVCMKLAKYKKENKELLSYLLFDSNDEKEFIRSVKEEIETQFAQLKFLQIYYQNKSIRKILRITNKYIKYSGNKQTEVELLICFCTSIKNSGIPIRLSTSLSNLYKNQVRKIQIAISALHEDLQYDYQQEIEGLNFL